ncbi:MAG TPA: sigma-70 family RNA polymerase sigma factor [Stellaceae bacterium]|nr:sigma-70 family RNA polymerase sigma factor [Stellaceae bacterium]
MAQDGDLDGLLRGEKAAWDGFVRRYAGLVVAAVRAIAREAGEVEDLAQEVFLRLCKDDFRLLRSYDPARAGLSTWITIVARSTARDAMRRLRPVSVPIEAVAESRLAIDPVEPVRKLKLPEALLSPRQREILTMLYDREMEVAEVAAALGIDPQTVRSAHHKAMVKLRAHFKAEVQ